MKSFTVMIEVLFWCSLGLILYTYFIYPAILFVGYSFAQLRSDWRHLFAGKDRRVPELQGDAVPNITFVIPAYNEEARLRQKLTNLREMDYPREKMQIIFVSDGSTDSTNDILESAGDLAIETIFLPQRSGKANALNQAIIRAQHGIVVFSDASTLFARDTLRKLGRHFVDPRIGAVCGALQFHSSHAKRQTESLYWKYETMMRLMEARLGATLTASGAVYALRREAYIPLGCTTVLDDFIIPMNARKAGYRIVYDPEATATDYGPESVEGEFTRRVRLATGSFQSIFFLLRVKMGVFGRFAFISHKLFRWFLPLLLCIFLVSSLGLIRYPVYGVFGVLELFFFLWASLGFLLRERLQGARYALLAYYLLAMNIAFLLGLLRCLTNQSEATWQRVS